MKNIINRIKLAFVAVLVALMSVPFGAFFNQARAAAPDLAPAEKTLSDGVVLSKKAEAVAGWNNKWKITLQVKAPKIDKSSKTVLVIDQSWSMNRGKRMEKSRNAATSLANKLLSSANNEIAIVSFDDGARVDLSFTSDIDSVTNAIKKWSPKYNNGTFTQGGMHEARELLKKSQADVKTIILLSDGQPTYNYPVKNPDSHLVSDDKLRPKYDDEEKFIPKGLKETDYNYGSSPIGAGNDIWYSYDRECIDQGLIICWDYEYHYYNSGFAATDEAGYYKGLGGFYAISLEDKHDPQNPTPGYTVLADMANAAGGDIYPADESNLQSIFDLIGGNIMNLIQSATVEDSMGTGIVVTEILGEGTVSGNGGATRLESHC